MTFENIIPSIVSGTIAPIIFVSIIWVYNNKIKPQIIWKKIGNSLSKIYAKSINIDVQNNTGRLIHIKTFKIIGDNKENKFITYANIKNCYLDNSQMPYNKDYYTLKPYAMLQLKIHYTKDSPGILHMCDKNTIIKVDNDSYHIGPSSLGLMKSMCGEKSLPKSLKKTKTSM